VAGAGSSIIEFSWEKDHIPELAATPVTAVMKSFLDKLGEKQSSLRKRRVNFTAIRH
jgi:hypothetical protein